MSESQAADGAANTHEPDQDHGSAPDLRAEVEGLKQTNQAVLGKMDQLISTMTPKKPEMSSEQYAQLLKDNPAAAIELAVEKQVQARTGNIKKELSQEYQKNEFDTRTEREFPLIKSDPEFQGLVKNQIREMINSGEMSVHSPTLVYRASQIAALKYKPKASTKSEKSEDGGGKSISSEAPRSGGAQGTKPSGDHQFDALAKMFGVKDRDAMKAKWDAHQKGNKR